GGGGAAAWGPGRRGGDWSSLFASRLRLFARSWRAGQRQVRHHAARLPAGIDDGLVGAAEHALHGFEIDALARYVGRLLVLLVDLAEARGLALGFGDRLLAVSLRVLGDLGR